LDIIEDDGSASSEYRFGVVVIFAFAYSRSKLKLSALISTSWNL
jgi:hypothetical protein